MTAKNGGVLIVGNFLSSTSGSYGVCEVLAHKLVQNGWRVTTTSTEMGRCHRLYDMLKTTWRERSEYSVAQVDVFSGPSFIWAQAVSWLLCRLHKPFILTLHGGNLPVFSRRWPGRVKRLLGSAASVTTPSHYMALELVWARPDIIVLPNGIDLSSYQFRLRQRVAPKLAWLRAFHAVYDPTLAAKTLDLLTGDFPEIELTMFGPDKGDGSLRAMQEWADQAGIMRSIHIPGPIPKKNVPQELAPFEIFLNTTTAESFGVAVVEAAALGMCIVTTNVGELPYLWQHEHDALLVPPNDPDAMAAAVRRILTEPDLAERLSRNARTKAEQFDWSVVLPQWEQLLLQVRTKS